MNSSKTFGFGVNPAIALNHFYVMIPINSALPVQVYERFSWTLADEQMLDDADVLKVQISRHKWGRISAALASEFNGRLKKDKLKTGKFAVGGTPIEKLLGKEMMVLLWGIEDCDPSVIPVAIRNWKGLMPEERWWLYTMTNASTGHINDKKGWRIALRYALCENPIEQMSIDHLLDFE